MVSLTPSPYQEREPVAQPGVPGLLDHVIGAHALSFEVPGRELARLLSGDRGLSPLAEDPREGRCHAAEVVGVLPCEPAAVWVLVKVAVSGPGALLSFGGQCQGWRLSGRASGRRGPGPGAG